jgi:hypothetical protein
MPATMNVICQPQVNAIHGMSIGAMIGCDFEFLSCVLHRANAPPQPSLDKSRCRLP